MTHIKEKLKEQFYPLTPTYSKKLRIAKLTASEWRIWSYLVEIDPWGDKYHDIETFTVMVECDCSKATFYRAIAKFQRLGLFDFQDKGISFKNEIGTERLRKGYRKNETDILKNETGFSEMRLNSQIRENETPKPLPDKASSSPQTIQTFPDPQTAGGEEKIQSEPAYTTVIDDDSPSADPSPQLTELSSILDKTFPDQNQIDREDKSSPDCHTNDTKTLTISTNNSHQNPPVSPSPSLLVSHSPIPSDLLTKLKNLKIPLDGAVKKAIASHHPSQVWGALRHIEETSEDIRSPRGVFLYQVPRQPKDNRKPPSERFTDEFKHWYQQAIASGLVINRPIASLGLYQFREPIVQLPDGSQWPWTQVRDGKHLPPTKEESEQAFEQHKKLIANLKTNSPQYQSSQEKAKHQLEFKPVPLSQDIPLPPELEAQLKDLGIPLNDVVRKAIASHPLAVIEGIIKLVRDKLSAIGTSGGKNAQKLFTYQLMTL